ncbi:hypothetical protein Tco_0422575, partial [Tanacetum coccineum]
MWSMTSRRECMTVADDREKGVIRGKAVDASLDYHESMGQNHKEQDTKLADQGNDAHHNEQPELNNVGEVDQNAEQCHDTCPMPATLTNNQTTELSNQSLAKKNLKNIRLKKTFAKPSILGKPVGRPLKNQSVVRQPTAFKSERPRISKPRFASQVDVNNDLSKPVTTHYLPKGRESAPAKPHHMIAPSSSRWVPTGKTFASSTTKVESEPPNGSNADIPNQCESEQALNVSAGTLLSAADQASVFMKMTFEQRGSTLVLHQMTSDHNRSELGIQDHSNEPSSSKLVPKVVPLAVKTATSRQELELLFHHHITML